MRLVDVDDRLRSSGLTKNPLTVLNEDVELSNVFILQPEGVIVADNQGIRVQSADIQSKILNYLNLANQSFSNLVLAPEYCCPWTIIDNIEAGACPIDGSLWVLGFQSITPSLLRNIIATKNSIEWVVDFPNENGKTFLNPLVYVFRSTTQAQQIKITCLVQFKTKPMVDTELQLERANLILGNDIYFFKNAINSIHLASIICSDSLDDFDANGLFPQWAHLPHILLHPQMNKDPRHPIFRSYRDKWAKKTGEKKHVICVNWARGTKINNNGTRDDFGHSGFYTKDDPKVGVNDHQLNHNNGLYYTYSKDRTHAFYLNYDEHVFHLRISKVGRSTVNAASANFACPKSENIYSWTATTNWQISANVDDGYIGNCVWGRNVYQCLSGQNAITQIEKELLINWATGSIDGSVREFNKTESVNVSDSESIKRLTFTHDSSQDSRNYRVFKSTLFNELCGSILGNKLNYPPNIDKCSLNPTMRFLDKKFNLVSGNEEVFVCYIGEADDDQVERIFNAICRSFHEKDRRELCIWYKRDNKIKYRVENNNHINASFSESPVDIARE